MHKLALFRLHLIVFLWGFTAILGKLIHASAENSRILQDAVCCRISFYFHQGF